MLVGYMRISTSETRQSTDLQRDALIAAGIDPRNLYDDVASGAKVDRPGLKRCLEYLTKGDVLVVWKLDRLGRSLPHLVTLLEDLKGRGVQFRSLTEGMDTTTPSGELLFNMVASLAQFERALIRERVNAGLAAARKRGKVGGRPRAISDEKMELIAAALAQGRSKAEVARAFEVSRATLHRELGRREGTGALTTTKPTSKKAQATGPCA
jgi:DNA invertase Pin-like site-specific DNA recombinase